MRPHETRHFRPAGSVVALGTDLYEYLSYRNPALSREPSAILGRQHERLHHFGVEIVAAKSVKLAEPEVVTVEILIRGRIRIAAEVTKVLHQHERAIELLL